MNYYQKYVKYKKKYLNVLNIQSGGGVENITPETTFKLVTIDEFLENTDQTREYYYTDNDLKPVMFIQNEGGNYIINPEYTQSDYSAKINVVSNGKYRDINILDIKILSDVAGLRKKLEDIYSKNKGWSDRQEKTAELLKNEGLNAEKNKNTVVGLMSLINKKLYTKDNDIIHQVSKLSHDDDEQTIEKEKLYKDNDIIHQVSKLSHDYNKQIINLIHQVLNLSHDNEQTINSMISHMKDLNTKRDNFNSVKAMGTYTDKDSVTFNNNVLQKAEEIKGLFIKHYSIPVIK